MVEKRGKSAWKHDATTIQALTGVDPYEQKTVTPAELIRRGASEKLVKGLCERPVIGRKLDRVSDRDIERMFKR